MGVGGEIETGTTRRVRRLKRWRWCLGGGLGRPVRRGGREESVAVDYGWRKNSSQTCVEGAECGRGLGGGHDWGEVEREAGRRIYDGAGVE